MANTANVVISPTWTLVVANAKTAFTLSATENDSPVLVATTAADNTAPATGIVGHRLTSAYPLTRTLLPSGSVWARSSRDGVIICVDAA